LSIVGRRRPAGRLEEPHQLPLFDRLAAHRPRRPAIEEQGLDRIIRRPVLTPPGILGHVESLASSFEPTNSTSSNHRSPAKSKGKGGIARRGARTHTQLTS